MYMLELGLFVSSLCEQCDVRTYVCMFQEEC